MINKHTLVLTLFLDFFQLVSSLYCMFSLLAFRLYWIDLSLWNTFQQFSFDKSQLFNFNFFKTEIYLKTYKKNKICYEILQSRTKFVAECCQKFQKCVMSPY